MTNNYSWDECVSKVEELLGLGYTVLQIEEETEFDYEDILWACQTMRDKK
jgi:hypothetical protein